MQWNVIPMRCNRQKQISIISGCWTSLPFASLTTLVKSLDTSNDSASSLVDTWDDAFFYKGFMEGQTRLHTWKFLDQILAQRCLINLEHTCNCFQHSLIGKWCIASGNEWPILCSERKPLEYYNCWWCNLRLFLWWWDYWNALVFYYGNTKSDILYLYKLELASYWPMET